MSGEFTDFLDPAIVHDMRVLVISEGAGVQLFAVPERFARRSIDKQMWAVLHELETQTRAAVFDVLGDDADRFVSRDKIATAGGVTAGTGLALLPHRLQLHALVEGTRLFVPHFRKLADYFAGTPRAEFFDYVLAHELAIAELARRALARDPSFLQPVEVLLGAVPK